MLYGQIFLNRNDRPCSIIVAACRNFSAWGQDSERFCGVEKLDRNIPQDVFWMLKIWRNIWAWSHWLGKILLSEFLKVKLPILLSNKDCIYLSDNTIGIIRALENYFHILSSDFWESQICRKEIFLKDALISRYVLYIRYSKNTTFETLIRPIKV